MGLFGKKKDKVVDWSENYKLQAKRATGNSSSKSEDSNMGFLGNLASSNSSNNVSWDDDSSPQPEEKKQKLAKRLLDMTNKMEDMSNQIYHLKQRVELLEKKMKISFE